MTIFKIGVKLFSNKFKDRLLKMPKRLHNN